MMLPTPAETVGMSSERLSKIRTVFRREVAADRMPGVVVMISRRDALVYAEAIGFQNKEAGIPMKTDSIFRLLSLTKAFVTTAAMMLVEDGAIALNDPVSSVFPGFASMSVFTKGADGQPSTEPAKREMTIQDLLRHTAGLDVPEFPMTPEAIRGPYRESKVVREGAPIGEYRLLTPDQQVEALSRVTLSSHPGENWRYSVSTELLGRVIEKISGSTLGAFLAERLFRPLQMNDTGFFVPEAKWGRLAQPLGIDVTTGLPMPSMLDVTKQMPSESGSAGAVSTAGDYLTFARMLLNGGSLNGVRYLSPTTIRLMTSDHLDGMPMEPVSPSGLILGVEGYTFSLGFMVRRASGVAAIPGSEGEYMWAGAGGTFSWNDPKEQLAVVMMAQTPNVIRVKYRHLIKQLVAQAIVE